MTLALSFDNSYGRLPEQFYTKLAPTPVATPKLVALNTPLAKRLGLDPEGLTSPDGVSMLAGNDVPHGADPLAQAYAGHQFGHFNPQLGDGRAVLIGEVVAPDGARFDLQLKGSGPTPYSRMGDGRAWLGPCAARVYRLGSDGRPWCSDDPCAGCCNERRDRRPRDPVARRGSDPRCLKSHTGWYLPVFCRAAGHRSP